MVRFLLPVLTLVMLALPAASIAAPAATVESQTTTSKSNTSQESDSQSAEAVMQQFAGDDEVSPQRKIETERKHQILFLMGVSLLVLLLITGTLGIAMVAFGKDVFLPHMIFAGLSLTLAAVHSATAIAWFWPW
jgi:cytochrome b subunit of formate dehydrogenase